MLSNYQESLSLISITIFLIWLPCSKFEAREASQKIAISKYKGQSNSQERCLVLFNQVQRACQLGVEGQSKSWERCRGLVNYVLRACQLEIKKLPQLSPCCTVLCSLKKYWSSFDLDEKCKENFFQSKNLKTVKSESILFFP